jgi:hypothetical protein
MSTDQLTWTCPACGGERTSGANSGNIYCGDCNRIYPVADSATSSADTGSSAEEAIRQVA